MRAMVLAAGLGTRMRPLTETTPKPLIEVGGKKLIDWSLDALVQAGIREIVVNVSYLAQQVEAHISKRSDATYTLSYEPHPLETGGGIKKALPYLGDSPFLVMNSDAFYLEGEKAIRALMSDTSPAPITLIVQNKRAAIGYDGAGDFHCDGAGNIRRKGAQESEAPFVFTGIQKLQPMIFSSVLAEKFSMNLLYDKHVAADGTLKQVAGLRHDGVWLHVGTPDQKRRAEAHLEKWV